ncbi:MAG: pyridoxal phosphate-dependent aminotransferase [Acidimicrobiia bacterium]|nr:pyridoxal phosphate-dependent aminotransferase [Actinomycetota bacterium]MBL6924696.1 pyridoxal phosphate-dependent aminotransferase [Acidimicrobiia bacterium]MBL6926403.1 pyridoxal phosphate-dependent aminotransferase [Acidimicrobiia bacterium]
MNEPRRFLVERLREFGITVFAEMSALADRTGAINLGQGFPDSDGPEEVREAAVAAIRAGHNQYPPGRGILSLRQAVADHQRRFYGIDLDPEAEVLITAGASEAIAAAMLALVEPGDEVIMFEPYFDHYATSVVLAGGHRHVVALREPDLSFDVAELEAAVGPRTRLILVNTPHNPSGKVFSAHEMEQIARVAVEHNLLVITDEVYEHLIYDGGSHIPLATLPGMWERTLTISSAGKSFGFTGWKVGWASGPEAMVSALLTAKQSLTYVSGGPFQHALVTALELGDDYFTQLADDLEAKRDLLSEGLRSAGFGVFPTAGTYFVTADIRPLGAEDGVEFCMSMPERCGVVAVPSVVFYDNEDAGRHLIRFAFCKRPEVLAEAAERLAGMGGSS